MGCSHCPSGLGNRCDGPLGLDDIEVGCDCGCHRCERCGSAYCKTMGGRDDCTTEDDEEDEQQCRENDIQEAFEPKRKPVERGNQKTLEDLP